MLLSIWLNELKFEAGLVGRSTHDGVASRFNMAQMALSQLDAIQLLDEPERSKTLRDLANKVN